MGADAARDAPESDEGPPGLPGRVIVEPTALTVSEAGGTAALAVSLGTEPASDVVVTLESSDAGEATVGTEALTFTPENWSTPQTVVVTGVDDACCDGVQVAEIVVQAEGVANYSDVPVERVSVAVADDDDPAVSVMPGAVTVVEAGASASFSVTLAGCACEEPSPAGPVSIPVSVSDEAQLEVDTDELVFTAENFDAPQQVLVWAVDDGLVEVPQQHAVVLGAATGGGYDGFDAPDVAVTVLSDDDPYFIVAPSALTTSEIGTTGTFDASLSPPPQVPVVVAATVGDPTEGSISPATVTFDPAHPGPHTFTLTGVHDAACDGNRAYEVTLAATSSNEGYDGVQLTSVAVVNQDIDACEVVVLPPSITVTEGQSASFTVALSSDPGEVVTIDLSRTSIELGVAPTQLTFDSTNFATPQVVTVTVLDNIFTDGDRTRVVDMMLTATMGYAGAVVADVDVLVIDDD